MSLSSHLATAPSPKLQNGGCSLEKSIQPIDLPLHIQLDNFKLLSMDLKNQKKDENLQNCRA